MGGWHNQPTDMRKVRRRAERNLIFGMVLVFLVGGGVLIGLIYGWSSLITALICLVPGVVMVVAIWLILRLSDYLIGRDE